jgi:hypothetical protein
MVVMVPVCKVFANAVAVAVMAGWADAGTAKEQASG